MIRFSQFERYKYNLVYGFSAKQDGSMNRRAENKNRDDYFLKMGINPDAVITADLVNGSNVKRVDKNCAGKMAQSVDALVANEKKLFLSATGADCFLVYFYDPVKQGVGIAHAGWRGLMSGVIKNTIEMFGSGFASSSENIVVGISPGIRSCHFEISPSDKDKFSGYEKFLLERVGKFYVDLPGIIKDQLEEKGIAENNISDCKVCTYCSEQDYFSFRRDKPAQVECMAGYIGLL